MRDLRPGGDRRPGRDQDGPFTPSATWLRDGFSVQHPPPLNLTTSTSTPPSGPPTMSPSSSTTGSSRRSSSPRPTPCSSCSASPRFPDAGRRPGRPAPTPRSSSSTGSAATGARPARGRSTSRRRALCALVHHGHRLPGRPVRHALRAIRPCGLVERQVPSDELRLQGRGDPPQHLAPAGRTLGRGQSRRRPGRRPRGQAALRGQRPGRRRRPLAGRPDQEKRADQLVGLLAFRNYSSLRYYGEDGVVDLEQGGG